jgi:hypothetical protein
LWKVLIHEGFHISFCLGENGATQGTIEVLEDLSILVPPISSDPQLVGFINDRKNSQKEYQIRADGFWSHLNWKTFKECCSGSTGYNAAELSVENKYGVTITRVNPPNPSTSPCPNVQCSTGATLVRYSMTFCGVTIIFDHLFIP